MKKKITIRQLVNSSKTTEEKQELLKYCGMDIKEISGHHQVFSDEDYVGEIEENGLRRARRMLFSLHL